MYAELQGTMLTYASLISSMKYSSNAWVSIANSYQKYTSCYCCHAGSSLGSLPIARRSLRAICQHIHQHQRPQIDAKQRRIGRQPRGVRLWLRIRFCLGPQLGKQKLQRMLRQRKAHLALRAVTA